MEEKKEYVGVRVFKEQITALKEIAITNHRTTSDELRKMIDEYIKAYNKEKGRK